jgi:hypothetical protein
MALRAHPALIASAVARAGKHVCAPRSLPVLALALLRRFFAIPDLDRQVQQQATSRCGEAAATSSRIGNGRDGLALLASLKGNFACPVSC